ncbi:MAG: hypothetical protein K8S87_09825 [Planctomycetes bacterium]|nr:hypothetical protein [Planctomycetota bacterium]
MNKLTLLAIAMMIICAGVIAVAQNDGKNNTDTTPTGEKFALKWKFAKDQSLKYEISTETSSDIENQGSTITEMKNMTSNVTLKCTEIKDKLMSLEMKYERIRFNQFSSLFPNPIRFDSNKKEDNTRTIYDIALLPYATIVKKDKSFTFDLSSAGKVNNVKGYDTLINDIYTELKDPIYAKTKEKILETFSNKVMQTTLDALFGILPETPMTIGMSWEKAYTTKVLYVGEVKVTSTFTLDKVYMENDKLFASIKLDSKAKTVRMNEKESEIIEGFKVKGTLKDSQLSGTFVFNVADGNINVYEANQKLNFKIEVVCEGRKLETDKTVTNKISMKLMPAEKAIEKAEEKKELSGS